MDAITINPASEAQIPLLVPLLEAQLREHHIESSPDGLAAVFTVFFAQPEHGILLTAFHHDVLIGFAYASRILSFEHGGLSGWLEELYVVPEWRSRGAGSALLAAVITAATERGWPALDIEVDSDHRRSLPFYARNGFRPVSRVRLVRSLSGRPVA